MSISSEAAGSATAAFAASSSAPSVSISPSFDDSCRPIELTVAGRVPSPPTPLLLRKSELMMYSEGYSELK